MAENLDQRSDPSLDADTLRAGLDECLSNIQGESSFALFEALDNAPNPGLYLKNGGGVGLPLSDRDAEAIAPFGKREKTLVDTSVRKTWEVSPGDFELRNPAWIPFVQTIIKKVSAGLGVDATSNRVSAELYKMLLYDEGALFKPHQDSEKAPLRRFSGVAHEVKPVLSGRRLVLTYNLIHDTLGSNELCANSDTAMVKLRLLLPSWIKGLEGYDMPATLAYLLEHQHGRLKSHDQKVVSHLEEACEEFGLCFYLANLETKISGGCDDMWDDDGWGGGTREITDETDRNATLETVVELDGTKIAKSVYLDEESFIQVDAFDGQGPDDEDCSGFTGNEGVSTTHFYHRTVALLVPKDYKIEFFLGQETRLTEINSNSNPDLEPTKSKTLSWIERLSAKSIENPEDHSTKEGLEAICNIVRSRLDAWETWPERARQTKRPPYCSEILARFMIVSVELDHRSLFPASFEAWAGKDIQVPRSGIPGHFQTGYQRTSFNVQNYSEHWASYVGKASYCIIERDSQRDPSTTIQSTCPLGEKGSAVVWQ
ncbi:hypothetical protein LSUE1_G009132 [Lachnellula suecica]|uniref:Prolyl 4-hydroxylase alpha subunit Fe(2+) 2OG dioxygenase domain-containing protein n=1 Tax=Lachnellula suecica TaxID=602035 RepID=A0A8T9BUB8_9HELO|nr:hypothetical protein LSUE1_G009132 [Lachnellula suecica]